VDDDAAATPLRSVVSGELTPRDSTAGKPVRIVSARVSLGDRLREIWDSRELLVYMVRTEIKVKYKNSALGLVWSMISPAMSLIIFWFVFGYLLPNAYPNFVIYLFSGLLFWNFFSVGVQSATGVIVGRAGIVKKVAFPREILALSAMGTAGVFLFFQSLVMILFMVVLQYAPDWPLLPLLIPALLATMIIGSALGILLSAANVYLRDMQHLIEVVFTAWFWACPIVYSFWNSLHAKVGPTISWIYLIINPMTPIILTSQRVLYAHPRVQLTSPGHQLVQILPPWHWYVYLEMDSILIVAGLLLLVVALVVFARVEGNFAEEL